MQSADNVSSMLIAPVQVLFELSPVAGYEIEVIIIWFYLVDLPSIRPVELIMAKVSIWVDGRLRYVFFVILVQFNFYGYVVSGGRLTTFDSDDLSVI